MLVCCVGGLHVFPPEHVVWCLCDCSVHCGCYIISTAHGPYHLAANRGLCPTIVALRTAVVQVLVYSGLLLCV
jgi:hypothetical protein